MSPRELPSSMSRKPLSSVRLPSLPRCGRQVSFELGSPPFAFPTLLVRQASAECPSLKKCKGGGIHGSKSPRPTQARRIHRSKTLSEVVEEKVRSHPESPPEQPRMERRRRRSKTSISQHSMMVPLVSPQGSHIGSSTSPSSVAITTEGSPPHGRLMVSPQWRRGAQIGLGSYGRVYKAQDQVSGCIFAVKEAVASSPGEEERRFLEKLEAELEICRSLRHPHIVSCLGHERLDDHLCIFLEYVPGGSISSILREFGPLVGKVLHAAIRGSLDGLHYLHTHSPPVVHRDIKGANILVDLAFHVKLADFGCSKLNADTRSFTTIGSIPWMAPEVIIGQAGYGRKADIWSFGCTILEMATAASPWGSQGFDNIMAAIRRIGMTTDLPPIPPGLPEAGREFIARCVQRSVGARATSWDLLQHRFVLQASCRQ